MEFNHGPHCPHCAHGCTHPHEEGDVMEALLQVPGVPGSRMRHGGALYLPEHDITIASDDWVLTRCAFCRTEAMTPRELIPPFARPERDHDGALVMHCGPCMGDMTAGFRPGHNPHRRRRRARH